MRIAAAIRWYRQRLISQGKAAAIAGLSHRDFLMALYDAKVDASQVDIEEMKEDVERDLQPRCCSSRYPASCYQNCVRV
jgi:predicted HTH domain antitoxin